MLAAVVEAGTEASLERMVAASIPLRDPLEKAAEQSIRTRGSFPIAPGDHPLRIWSLGGGGAALAESAGLAFEERDFDGSLLREGAGAGLATSTVAILRPDRAWAGGLVLPDAIRQAADEAHSVLLFGPSILLEDLRPAGVLVAPGQDPLTLRAAARSAFARDEASA